MSRIEQAVIDEVRERADIVDIVSQYVTLKRTGANYKGLCPFHPEKTPSFTVTPDKGIYKCFGCGAGGNVFTFLEEQQQQSFAEIVRELARQYGIPMRYSEESNSEEEIFRNTLRQINQQALQFFQQQLNDPEQGHEARAYLKQRGVQEHFIQRFQLGYAANDWQMLIEHLRRQGIKDEALEKSGLFKRSDKSNRLYDFFRHRIIFPILSLNGDVIAFGGRTLDPDLGAKYINSPETEIYSKGKNVYGIHLAKQAIRKKDRVILVEGYLDVISAHQAGFEETVAALGTALTQAQSRQLLRFTDSKTLIMSYDADAAGQKAAEKGAEILEQITQGIPMRLQVLQIPDKEDPDTFLQKFGAEAFEDLLQNAKAFSAYYFDQLLNRNDLKSSVGKSIAAKACIEALLKMQDPVLQDEYVRYVASRLEIEESALRDQIRQSRRKNYYQQKKQDQQNPESDSQLSNPAIPVKKDYISELGLLFLMVQHPEKSDQTLPELQELRFLDLENEELRQYLVAMSEADIRLQWQDLFVAFPDRHMHQRLTEIMENPAFEQLDYEKSLADFSRNVKLNCLSLKMKGLSREIQAAEEANQHEHYLELMQHYIALTQDCSRLKHISQ